MESGIFVLIILAVAILLILMGIKTVAQGYNYTIERFGRYTRTLSPGLNIIIPFLDRVGSKLNMMERVMEVPSQEVITRDNAMVTVDGVAFYQVLDAAKATYEVNQLDVALLNLTMTNIRTVMGSMDLDQLLSQRDEINVKLLNVVDAAVHPWGVKITRIEIKDIAPPRDLVDAMARQMKAEREKRASILEAEGLRQADILEAEGKKQAKILAAEAREREAQAEANATLMVSQAISKGSVQAINYFVAEKYMNVLKELAGSPNQKVLMLPVEASSVIGAIAGIGDIAKEAFGKDSKNSNKGSVPSTK
ncbi:MAG TPA: SPFH/Band 7/PHB domain protein [Rhizobiales bacterium]|nr:SPFH/Band 7/PHB domain protein [Hyphomicrobiales bacterium]